jgi:hypothetical protein
MYTRYVRVTYVIHILYTRDNHGTNTGQLRENHGITDLKDLENLVLQSGSLKYGFGRTFQSKINEMKVLSIL